MVFPILDCAGDGARRMFLESEATSSASGRVTPTDDKDVKLHESGGMVFLPDVVLVGNEQ
jgi:hypothetical protein